MIDLHHAPALSLEQWLQMPAKDFVDDEDLQTSTVGDLLAWYSHGSRENLSPKAESDRLFLDGILTGICLAHGFAANIQIWQAFYDKAMERAEEEGLL